MASDPFAGYDAWKLDCPDLEDEEEVEDEEE